MLVEGSWGVVLLLTPRPLLSAVARQAVEGRVAGVVRILGARQLLQASATGRRPTRRRLAAGALVDAAHAASMVAAVVADVGPRRLTAASAAAAAGFAATGIAASRRA